MVYAVEMGSDAMIYIYIRVQTEFRKDCFRHSKIRERGDNR
jgi:hypothetical protein